MKAHKLFLMLFIICAFALTQTLTVRAQTTLNGTVNIITNAKADKVVSEGGRVYLSSVNINNSQINGDTITVTSRATIGGLKVNNGANAYVSSIGLDGTNLNNVNYKSTVNVNGDIEVDEGRLLNVSSAVLSGLDVGGDTTLDLNATVHGDIEVGDGGTVLIGGVNIEGEEINSGVNISSVTTTAPVDTTDSSIPVQATQIQTIPDPSIGSNPLDFGAAKASALKLPNNKLPGQFEDLSLADWIAGNGIGKARYDSGYHHNIPGKSTTYEIDIPGSSNSSIKPFKAGTVQEVGHNNAYGNYLVVKDKNGNLHRYAHLNSTTLKEGDPISLDTEIGKMGNTGACFTLYNGKYVDVRKHKELKRQGRGTHLHYDVRDENGSLVDPETV